MSFRKFHFLKLLKFQIDRNDVNASTNINVGLNALLPLQQFLSFTVIDESTLKSPFLFQQD